MRIDFVIAEAVDRIFRRNSDSFRVYELCQHRQVHLYSLEDGFMTPMAFAMRTIMAHEQRENLKLKTRRGLEGRYLAGAWATAPPYDYRVMDKRDKH